LDPRGKGAERPALRERPPKACDSPESEAQAATTAPPTVYSPRVPPTLDELVSLVRQGETEPSGLCVGARRW